MKWRWNNQYRMYIDSHYIASKILHVINVRFHIGDSVCWDSASELNFLSTCTCHDHHKLKSILIKSMHMHQSKLPFETCKISAYPFTCISTYCTWKCHVRLVFCQVSNPILPVDRPISFHLSKMLIFFYHKHLNKIILIILVTMHLLWAQETWLSKLWNFALAFDVSTLYAYPVSNQLSRS